MKKFIVNKKYNEKKLDTFLFDNIPNLSKNLYYQTLRKKDIKINGKRIHENTIIYENGEIQVFIADKLLNNFIVPKIIFEDKNILVINKPYNIEVTGENSLSSYIQKKYPLTSPMPCHRLDRNTTGLVLYAKNNEALNILYEKCHEALYFFWGKTYCHKQLVEKQSCTTRKRLFDGSKTFFRFFAEKCLTVGSKRRIKPFAPTSWPRPKGRREKKFSRMAKKFLTRV